MPSSIHSLPFAFPSFGSQISPGSLSIPCEMLWELEAWCCRGVWEHPGTAKCRVPEGSGIKTNHQDMQDIWFEQLLPPRRAPSPSGLLSTLLLAGVSAQTRALWPALPPWARRFPARASHWHHFQLQHGAAGLSFKQPVLPRCQTLLQSFTRAAPLIIHGHGSWAQRLE